MPLILPNTTSTTPPRKEKSLDTTATAVTRPCSTPTQIGDGTHTNNPMQLDILLKKMRIYETERCQQIITGNNFCDASSISSLSVAASERDGMLEEDTFCDVLRQEDRDKTSNTNDDDAAKRRLKPLKRCVNTFCFVPTIHDRPSPPRAAKRMRLN